MRSGAAAAAPAGGTRLAGRYLLLDRLGSGGMGVVWRARDELLGREVAIKDLWLPPSATAAERTRLRDRVLGEARVAARFSHPGAVVLHDVLVHDGRPLLVMELVDAPTLHELVEREGPLPPGLVARLGLRLLDTLEAAHRQGVVHLDVTPANVLVLADGGAKLADFGIAAAQDAPAREGGTVLGSPAYMAPEQIASEQVGPAADLWALAATMYFAVEECPRSASANRGRRWRRSWPTHLVRHGWPDRWVRPCSASWPSSRRSGRAPRGCASCSPPSRTATPTAGGRRPRHQPRGRGRPPTPRYGCPASLRPPPGSVPTLPRCQAPRPVRTWLVLATPCPPGRADHPILVHRRPVAAAAGLVRLGAVRQRQRDGAHGPAGPARQ